jgi:hypothetical protein
LLLVRFGRQHYAIVLPISHFLIDNTQAVSMISLRASLSSRRL